MLAASLPEFQGQIISFEPNPRSFADLASTVAQASLQDRVKALNKGVGRTASELRVEESDPYFTGLAKLSTSGTGQKIEVVPLDDVASDPPGFVKIDAEGMELEILSGAVRTLQNARPFLVFESFLNYETPQETYAPIDFLASHEYRLFIPLLTFAFDGMSVPTAYGEDIRQLMKKDSRPRLGVMEISSANRFVLKSHFNILGVHAARVPELWEVGIDDLGCLPTRQR